MSDRIMNQMRAGFLLLLAIAVLIGGCDSNNSLTAGIDRGGIKAPVAAEGPITGFGSIFVNDVRFDIGGAAIVVNGVPTNESALEIGQIVTVVGEIDAAGQNATADEVVFEANVRGKIAFIDPAQQRFVVLNQNVLVDAQTVFELGALPNLFSSLDVDDIVEVSGFSGSGGQIIATRIELSASLEYRVRGVASNVDTIAKTFSINSLMLDYSSAAVIEGFPGGEPEAGDDVVAVGQSFGPGGELRVQQLRLRDRVGVGAEGDEAEVEGLITRFVSAADFDVAGVPATADASTDYEGGDASDLALNVKIQVEGMLNSAGTIVATKIEVKDGGRVYDDD